jgi:hypothetical protein
MKKKNGAITAEELIEKLEADPEYRARKERRDEKFRRLREKYAQLDRPIVESLANLGFHVDSFDEIVKKFAPLPKPIVDVLLRALEECKDWKQREALARALGTAKEPFDGRILTRLYDETWDCGLQFAIANTIALARPHSIQEWIEKSDKHSKLRTDLTNLGYFA